MAKGLVTDGSSPPFVKRGIGVACQWHLILRTAWLFAVMTRKLMPTQTVVQDFLSITPYFMSMVSYARSFSCSGRTLSKGRFFRLLSRQCCERVRSTNGKAI